MPRASPASACGASATGIFPPAESKAGGPSSGGSSPSPAPPRLRPGEGSPPGRVPRRSGPPGRPEAGLASSGFPQRRDPEGSGPGRKGAPGPGAAESPAAEAARPPPSMSSRFWFWGKDAAPPSRGGSLAGSPAFKALQALRNSSHPQASEFLQAMERPCQIMANLMAENQQLQKEALQIHSLQAEVKQLKKRLGSPRVPEQPLLAENQRLRQELQERKDTQEDLLAELSGVQAENEALRQELEELRRGQAPQREMTADKLPVPQFVAFPVQVSVSGETRGYEKQFLRDVTKVLVGHKISLQVKEFQEDSGHLLVLFSPIALRAGTDIDNALDSFTSEQKILLVVLHHKAKNKPLVADKSQVQHPALVATVHAYYSMDDGFYHCQANEEAVASVVAAVVQLTPES